MRHFEARGKGEKGKGKGTHTHKNGAWRVVDRGQSTNCTWQSGKRMRIRVVQHVRMATASVWKEESIKDSLPCKEFSEFKVSLFINAFS